MCSPLSCGTSHFPTEEDEYKFEELLSPISKRHTKKTKDSENPFTNRGLDKFNALLDELERKKQQIYTQKGSQDISFIRFAYSSTGEWKPIVVKSKNRIRSDDEHRLLHRMQSNAEKDHVVKNVHHHEASKHVDHHDVVHHEKMKVRKMMNEGPHKESGSRRSWEIVMMEKLSQPSCYVPVMFILIILFLTLFGRTFTILCTSLGWYLIPLIKDKSSSSNSSSSLKSNMHGAKMKKEMKKVYSVITKESASSPYSVWSGPLDKLPTPRHRHQKSW